MRLGRLSGGGLGKGRPPTSELKLVLVGGALRPHLAQDTVPSPEGHGLATEQQGCHCQAHILEFHHMSPASSSFPALKGRATSLSPSGTTHYKDHFKSITEAQYVPHLLFGKARKHVMQS